MGDGIGMQKEDDTLIDVKVLFCGIELSSETRTARPKIIDVSTLINTGYRTALVRRPGEVRLRSMFDSGFILTVEREVLSLSMLNGDAAQHSVMWNEGNTNQRRQV